MKTVRVASRFVDDKLIVDIGEERQRVIHRCGAMLPLTRLASPELMELFEFMLTLYAADRLVPRPEPRWQRAFDITFPVQRLDAWNAARADLERLIWQCTGDEVAVCPVARPRDWIHADSRPTRFELEHQSPTAVFLLSEGLDSLCGAASAIQAPGEYVAFLSVITNSRRAKRLRLIKSALRLAYGEAVTFHSVKLKLVKAPADQERTQRSRTMLAIAAGLTVAAAYDSSRVVVSENGVGILNLPIPFVQAPHESSQVLHPANTAVWREVSARLVGGATLEYPNRFRTKAQMLRLLPNWAYSVIRSTSSCDAPQRRDKYDDCGVCSSCNYRRISLSVAGLAAYDTRYTAHPPRPGRYEPMDLLVHHGLLIGTALNEKDPWQALVRLQPTLADSIDAADRERDHLISATMDVLRSHVRETQAVRWLARAG